MAKIKISLTYKRKCKRILFTTTSFNPSSFTTKYLKPYISPFSKITSFHQKKNTFPWLCYLPPFQQSFPPAQRLLKATEAIPESCRQRTGSNIIPTNNINSKKHKWIPAQSHQWASSNKIPPNKQLSLYFGFLLSLNLNKKNVGRDQRR